MYPYNMAARFVLGSMPSLLRFTGYFFSIQGQNRAATTAIFLALPVSDVSRRSSDWRAEIGLSASALERKCNTFLKLSLNNNTTKRKQKRQYNVTIARQLRFKFNVKMVESLSGSTISRLVPAERSARSTRDWLADPQRTDYPQSGHPLTCQP